MEKCYISGPISKNDNSLSDFELAETEVRRLGYNPVNPCKLPHDHDKSYESFMREDIEALTGCQAIFMIGFWWKSEGASLEHAVAKAIGLKIFYQHEGLKSLIQVSTIDTGDPVINSIFLIRNAIRPLSNKEKLQAINYVKIDIVE